MPIPIKQCRRDKVKFNIMVVGESGLGKTTFLQSLLGKYIETVDKSPRKAINAKTNHISQIGTFELSTELGEMMEIVTFDSPGYGDLINNQECVDTIKTYIKTCHTQWRALEPQSMTEAEYLNADHRIHCVFYFIGPHRMKILDREFISQLAPIVPIIPIVAKADTMTVSERNEYLEIVNNTLNDISKTLKESCIYDFKYDDIAASKEPEEDVIPGGENPAVMERVPNLFAVVCDSSSERIYPWGTLRINDNKHSDFRRLQAVLFENEHHIKGLLDQTRLKSIRFCGDAVKQKGVELDHHSSIRFRPAK